MRFRIPLLASIAVGGVLLSACSSGHSAAPTNAACTSPTNGAVTVVARNVQFQQRCVTDVAGQKLTVTLDNQDSGTPHDWVLEGAGGTVKTKLVSGPKKAEVVVPALKPGNYTYVCSIHSNMSGTLKVSAAGVSPGATLPGGG